VRPPGWATAGLGVPPIGAKRAAQTLEDLFALMFDFAWSEIALIAGVALVVIGPKDLPVALRAISGFVKKARRMAGEFQTHVDEMMRDADLKSARFFDAATFPTMHFISTKLVNNQGQ